MQMRLIKSHTKPKSQSLHNPTPYSLLTYYYIYPHLSPQNTGNCVDIV